MSRGIHLCLEPTATSSRDLDFHTVPVPYFEWLSELTGGGPVGPVRLADKRKLLQFSGAPINNLRSNMISAMRSCRDCIWRGRTTNRFTVPAQQARLLAADMASSFFCYAPRGDTGTSKRVYHPLKF